MTILHSFRDTVTPPGPATFATKIGHQQIPIASRPCTFIPPRLQSNPSPGQRTCTSIVPSMKLSNIAALASGATLVISQPLEKRVLVVETVYENVVETVDVYTTIWVKAGEVGATASVTPQVNTAAIDQESSTSVAASAPVSTPPAVVDQPKPSPYKRPQRLRHKHRSKSSSQKPVATPAPVVISTVIPTPEPTPIPEPVFTPAPVSTPAVEVPPPVEENPAKAENNQPAPPVVQDSQPPSYGAQVAPADKPKEASTANSGGACGTVGGQCSGELTFFEAGRGACGWINDGETEDVFALAHGKPFESVISMTNNAPRLTGCRNDGNAKQRQSILWKNRHRHRRRQERQGQTGRQVHGLRTSFSESGKVAPANRTVERTRYRSLSPRN